MEGRCAVETWSQLGFSGAPTSPRLQVGSGTDVFICDGSDEVLVFDSGEKQLAAVLRFPAPVRDLSQSRDEQLLYVACSSGVYRVDLQRLRHRSESPSAEASSGPAELKVSSECLVVGADGVSSLLLIGSVLLTVCQTDSSWLLTVYQTPPQTPSGCCQTLGSSSLPLVAAPVYADGGSDPRTALVCFHCGGAAATSSSSSSSSPAPPEATSPHGHFRLEPALFKLLFGVEAALANSPVVLCGLPDGRLVFLPLRLPGSRPRVLHSLEQPVVFVGACLAAGGRARGLVALGERGRLVLIKADKGGGAEGGGSRLGFTEAYVPGPVACGCVEGSALCYSTGADLLALDLSKGGGEGKEEEEEEEEEETSRNVAAAALRSPKSLNVCRIASLAAPARRAAGGGELLGLSVEGRLLSISLPVRGREAGPCALPPAQVGRRVRDLLSAIGDVCERASALKTAISSQNQILKRVNQAVNVSFLLTGGGEERLPLKEKPIRCRARTGWSRLLQKDSLTLTCVLDNASPHVLDRGWTLSVTVLPLCLPVSAGGGSRSASFSFPLRRLSPGEAQEVSLPLAAASFPTTVNCSLVFSPSGLLGDEGEAGGGCVGVPLNALTVDWLHVLRPSRPGATPAVQAPDPVSDFLNSRRVGRSDRGGESSPKAETYSARVRVSSDFLKDTLTSRSSGLPTGDQRLDPADLSASLLDWLLRGGDGGVKAGHPGETIDRSGPAIHALGPDGATVKLAATEVSVGGGEGEARAAVELHIESSSLAAVCGLHHAVLSRILILLQTAPEKSATTELHSLGVMEALQRAEVLQNRIAAGAAAGQKSRLLLSVYRELRENPLLII